MEAGDNVDVTLDVDQATGDKTYTVSAHTDESEIQRIEELEREMVHSLEEIRRMKANMLTVSEDDEVGGNGIVFSEGMEDGD